MKSIRSSLKVNDPWTERIRSYRLIYILSVVTIRSSLWYEKSKSLKIVYVKKRSCTLSKDRLLKQDRILFMIVHFYDQLNDSINKHFWNFHEMTTFLKTLGEFRSWNLMNFQNGYFKMDFACTINSYAQGSKVSLNSFFGISNCSRILCRIFGLYEEVDFKFNSWKNLKFYIF